MIPANLRQEMQVTGSQQVPSAVESLAMNWRDHIVCDPQVLCGKPTLKGTRLSVEFVLELLAGGWGKSDLAENYPNLTEERIRAVLSYAAESIREEKLYLLPNAGKPV